MQCAAQKSLLVRKIMVENSSGAASFSRHGSQISATYSVPSNNSKSSASNFDAARLMINNFWHGILE